MKILILDGCTHYEKINVAGLLPNEHQVIHIRLNEQNILNCTGCMSCVWNMEKMNPGDCILDDDMKFIYPAFIHSDLVIFVTDILFGGFSFQLKKVIDRLLPALFTAPLRKRGADVGHIMRYRKRPSILAIGAQKSYDKDAADIFHELVNRISTLWDVPYSNSFIYALNKNLDSGNQKIQYKISNWVNNLK